MKFEDELKFRVEEIFSKRWSIRTGRQIPQDNSIALGNEALKLDATVLYADLSDSTRLVDKATPEFAAAIYKTYLLCCGKIVKKEGGEITAYDGDRLMAVFIGDNKNTSAVQAALKINAAVYKMINPSIIKFYPKDKYVVKQVVGVDTSELFVAKTGIRGANDLVWVGSAANYAAKLCSIKGSYSTYITKSVYDNIDDYKNSDSNVIWSKLQWNSMNNRVIYGSTHYMDL